MNRVGGNLSQSVFGLFPIWWKSAAEAAFEGSIFCCVTKVLSHLEGSINMLPTKVPYIFRLHWWVYPISGENGS